MILDGVRCVVFDVDDTLYLERDYVRSGFSAVGRVVEERFGAQEFETTAWAMFEDGVRGDTFDVALRTVGIDPSPGLIADLVAVYRAHRPDIALLEDARACLDKWSADRAVAVITDGPAVSQRAKVDVLGLSAWCDPIILTAELGDDFGKPNPHAFRLVAERAGVAHDLCAYVADNPAKDFIAPIDLGWRTVRVRRPGSLHELVDTASPVDEEVTALRALA